jgi:serine protease Do/serine protease DegQ
VVNISVVTRSPEENNPLARDPFFRRFFGLRAPEPQVSAGSGVIVDARSGHVLTNHHVVKDATAVFVVLKDNRRFQARVVGSDAGTDIALLAIPPEDLVEARFGDSDALQVGDFVLAIGNPFGIGQTVTSGIVSALGRTGLLSEGFEDFIQTDASINPGNSGGALINLKGELVGINTAIIGPTGGNVGIGFAVPSTIARAVMAQLIRYGEVRRGRLGVTAREGAVLAQVQPGSPAAAAGLREGDVVLSIGNRPVRGSADLRTRLGLAPVGETLDLRVARGAEERRVQVRIGEVEAGGTAGAETVAQLTGAALANAERAAGGAKEPVIYVARVEPGSNAFRLGVRGGDLIIGVNRKRVGTVADLAAALRGNERVALNLLRGDVLLTIPVR